MLRDEVESLMLLRDGALSAADAALLRARLAEEPALRRQYDELGALSRALNEHLAAEPSPDFSVRVMAQVTSSEQVAPGLLIVVSRWLAQPIAVPLAAAAALAIMLFVGLPEPVDPPQLAPAASAARSTPEAPILAADETEIEDIDNRTDYNVLVLAAPGSSNRLIWLSRRVVSDEG